jgi:hypothetical protein
MGLSSLLDVLEHEALAEERLLPNTFCLVAKSDGGCERPTICFEVTFEKADTRKFP